jgi:hypothetical protein
VCVCVLHVLGCSSCSKQTRSFSKNTREDGYPSNQDSCACHQINLFCLCTQVIATARLLGQQDTEKKGAPQKSGRSPDNQIGDWLEQSNGQIKIQGTAQDGPSIMLRSGSKVRTGATKWVLDTDAQMVQFLSGGSNNTTREVSMVGGALALASCGRPQSAALKR